MLFVDYIANERFNAVLALHEKELVIKKIKLMSYRVRDFLLYSCVLTRPPPRDSPVFATWRIALDACTKDGEQSTINFIETIKGNDNTKHRNHLFTHSLDRDFAKL